MSRAHAGTTPYFMACIFAIAAASISPAIAQPAPAESGQKAPDTITLAIGGYYNCIVTYASRFARTTERVEDITSAALVTCRGQIDAVRESMTSPASGPMPASAMQNLVDGLESNGRRMAAKSLLEARYPNAK